MATTDVPERWVDLADDALRSDHCNHPVPEGEKCSWCARDNWRPEAEVALTPVLADLRRQVEALSKKPDRLYLPEEVDAFNDAFTLVLDLLDTGGTDGNN